jgi:diguanylate cyclase (GGDEF)-like protein
MRILELGQNPEVTLGEVAKVITLDPALAVKLLRMANSPLYARHRKTENLRQAITLFGVEGTITLALSFSIISNLKGRSDHRFDYDFFWRRSLAVAACAQTLGERIGVPGKEDLFLCGLLQDIGMLALAKAMPDLYQATAMQGGHDATVDHERARLGLDHAEIGAWLLQRWNFPEELRLIICGSHDPATPAVPSAGVRQQMNIVAVASDMAEILNGRGTTGTRNRSLVRACELLQVDGELVAECLESSATALRDLAPMFEVGVDDPIELDSILNEARELILLRHINVMQRSSVLAKTAELLEDRTRKLEEENRRDILTGLYNRSYLNQALVEEIRMAERHDWPFTVIFIDLDDFKKVNDEYGHLIGDVILKNSARILTENTRGSDIVARYGGEEFVVVLPGAGMEGARMTCERLLGAFRNMRHKIEGLALAVTASIGAAIHGEEHKFDDLEAVLKAADHALYIAKRSGRNRCIFFDPTQL